MGFPGHRADIRWVFGCYRIDVNYIWAGVRYVLRWALVVKRRVLGGMGMAVNLHWIFTSLASGRHCGGVELGLDLRWVGNAAELGLDWIGIR